MKALVTGASSGIGYDMACYLASKNIDLIIVARRKDRLEALKDKFPNANIKVLEIDLSKEKDLELLVNKVKNEDIDILINNAGFGLFGTFDKTDLDTEMKMIDVNIKAVHYLTKYFLQIFIERDGGYILNVASSAGFMAGPKLSTYYATKNYCLRLSEAIYQELKENNSHVSISVLCPGPVDTEFNAVAHGTFKTKSASSEYVAKYAIDNMFKGKLIIVPTIKMKLVVFLIRFVPTKILLKVTSSIQERKINPKRK